MERCRLAVLVSGAAVAAALLIALLIRRPAIGGILLAVLAVLAVVVFLLVRRRRIRGRSRCENLAGTSASSSADPDLEHNTDHPAPVKKKKKPKKKKPKKNEAPFDVSSFGPRSFTYEELSIATANFHESRLLGKGGSGHVYRGALPADGSLVAVKCIDHNSSHGIKEFIAEVTIISGIRHRNLVKLRGWCYVSGHVGSGGRRLLLVYELMPNGSLDHLLFHDDAAGGMRLTWPRRLHVLQGLASALHYLHEECESVILHRDVKSSNVMLDEGFNAKLGDFGLSRQVQQGMIALSTTLAGTRGYLAPELCFGISKATKETDVYSFGAVLLEVACGKRALDPRIGNAEHVEGLLVDWVWDLHSRGKLLDAVDARLGGQYDLAQMWFVMVLGLACSHPDPKARPTIRNASEALQHATVAAAKLPLPSIPLSKPTPSYYSAGHSASNLSTDSWSTSSDVISSAHDS